MVGCVVAVVSRVDAALVINVNYIGTPNAQYESAFISAAATWQSLLTGYQDGFVTGHSFGSSSMIGQRLNAVSIDASGYKLATDGLMEFDSADIAGFSAAELDSLILHEMGHVLGFGTLWVDNGVYVNGSGEFTGAHATAVWQDEFGQVGTPDVELEGPLGTSNVHWNEVQNGAALTGITDGQNRDMAFELMTGWLNPNSFISDLTVASFRDIGFSGAVAVPEPTSLRFLALVGLPALALRRIRGRHRVTPTGCRRR